MKRIVFYILLLSGLLAMGCKTDSDNDETGEYINPGFTTKTVDANKDFSIAGATGSGESCMAIVYQGKVNNINYVGLAAKNDTFSIKIYWGASSFPESVNLPAGSYTIKITSGANTYTTTTDSLVLTRTQPNTGLYRYTFVSAITVTGTAGDIIIGANDYIEGYIY